MTNAKAPTAAQLEEGPVVNLHHAGWVDHMVVLKGFGYPLPFDESGNVVVLLSDYREGLGDNQARDLGITVDKPAPPKAQAKHAKRPAAKKPAASKRPKVRKKSK